MSEVEALESISRIARQAGDVILQVYATDFSVRGKDDASPVTDADERAEAVILAALAALTPGTPVVAEESVAAGGCPTSAARAAGSGWSIRWTATMSSSAATVSPS